MNVYKGDFGGGLYKDNIIIGIVSSVYSGETLKLIVFTDVKYHLPWIRQTIFDKDNPAFLELDNFYFGNN